MSNHLLITGKPGVGKTTFIKKIVPILKEKYTLAGFYTEEICKNGHRVGFSIHTINGKSGILAQSGILPSENYYQFGKYMISVNDIEDIMVPEFSKKAEIIICDEIGKMELFSSKFKESIWNALDSKYLILGTISYHNIPFINTIKNREDTTILELTFFNREKLQQIVIHEINKRMKKKLSINEDVH